MRWFYKLPLRLRSLFWRSRVEMEMTDELRFHLEKLIEEKVAKGMAPKDARYAALRELGGVEQIKEECRDTRRVNLVENLIQDVRYGLRQLRRSPGFTAVAVITLALGIGANTAIFSVVNPVLIRTLPYKNPDRLVLLRERTKDMPPDAWWAAAPANFLDWQKQSHDLEAMGAAYELDVNLTGRGEPERLHARRFTANFFPMLGVQPSLGRSFVEQEDHVAILSHKLWERRFASEPNVIGQTLRLDDQVYTLIGVMPSGFQLFPQAEIFLPNPFLEVSPTERLTKILDVVARLKPNVTLAQAQSEMNIIASRLEGEYPVKEKEKHWSVKVIALYNGLTHEVRPHLLVLVYAVGFVLLIACANLASLLLARGATRQREVAVRSALGASRPRLIRQTLTESALLGLSGGIAGLVIARWGIQLLLAARTDKFYQYRDIAGALEEIHISWQVLGFTLVLSLASGLLFGLIPAVFGSKPDLNGCLKESGTAATTGLGHRRALNVLVIGEIALSLVLLSGASLMIRSIIRLVEENPHFDVSKVLRFGLVLPSEKYSADAGTGPNKVKLVTISPRRDLFMEDLIRHLKGVPGIESAAAWSDLYGAGQVRLEGEPEARGQQVDACQWISPGYFRTMGIPLLKGRDFTELDTEGAPGVVIVNENMARSFWPGQQVIGRRLLWQYWDFISDKETYVPSEIVGVVRDIRYSPDSPPSPWFYLPYSQDRGKMPKWAAVNRFNMTFLVRTSSDPKAFATSAQKAVWDVDRFQPINEMKTMDEDFWSSLDQRRFYMHLLIIFATIALLLAAIGVYGVMTYSVTRRTHEIGVRKALGATTGEVVWLIVRQGLTLVLIAVPIGLAAALALTRFLATFLYGVKPTDPVTLGATSLLLTTVGLAACYIPARRATKVDPMVALRCE